MHSHSRIQHKISAFRRLISEHGVAWVVALLVQRYFIRKAAPLLSNVASNRIRSWVARNSAPIHIYVSPVDWRYPYQQRPHHIVREFHARKIPTIFVTPTTGYDRTISASEESPTLLLTPHCHAAISACERPVVYLLSTDIRCDEALLALIASRDGIIVYDYIDVMDDAVISGKYTEKRLALHERLLKDESRVAVAATSQALFDHAAQCRKSHLGLITNGVELEPFRGQRRGASIRKDFSGPAKLGKPIIGYFGAFATWFDYELINRLAIERPNYSIVLFGPDLDGSGDRFDRSQANLFVLSAMAYKDIPRHAAWFDVCLVPFVINSITIACSPLKIFEYMALGKPTVSTDIPECRKYRSVLIGSTPETFIAAVDKALSLTADRSFAALAKSEAEVNSWARKVDDLQTLVNSMQRP